MKVCVLYSGGKDSNLALMKAKKYCEISCLLSIKPESEESEIFHYPNAKLTELQAKALEIPIITVNSTNDEKSSINSLKEGLIQAKEMGIEGVVTGAIRSTYQATRFQKICKELDLWCFNPLWLRDEISILKEILENNFKVMFVRVAGLSEKFLGKIIDEKIVKEIEKIKSYINPAGEGGEYETFVLYMPEFKKEIEIKKFEVVRNNEYDSTLIIKEAILR